MSVYLKRQALQAEDGLRLIDTHCHLDCEPLRTHLDRIMAAARQAGVTGCVVPGIHPHDWERLGSVVHSHAGVHAAYGVHPMHADVFDDLVLDRLACCAPEGIAIGEIGLDDRCGVDLQLQEVAFREQLRLAGRLGLPVLIHCRGALQRTLRILQQERSCSAGGIMHAYSGSPEMARDFISLGFAISICGTVTWQGAMRPLRLAREIPLESLVLETDAPDLTPQAYRGRWNRPAWLPEILRKVAEVRGVGIQELAQSTFATSRRILSRLKDC